MTTITITTPALDWLTWVEKVETLVGHSLYECNEPEVDGYCYGDLYDQWADEFSPEEAAHRVARADTMRMHPSWGC